jgi:putative acetyltransferase
MMAIYLGIPDSDFTPMDDRFVLGEKMWPVIKALIMTNIENAHSIILEGVQLLPHLLRDFPPDYLEDILVVFVFFSERYIMDNFDDKIIIYRSAIENRSDVDDITGAKMISETRQLKEDCITNRVVFFEIDNDFHAGMKEARDYILAQMGKR